jgi:hypothetical protein
MDSFNIHCQWRTAVTVQGSAYNFPHRFTHEFRDKYRRPAIYRWRVLKNAGETKEPIYIGECEDLVQRMQRVLTPAKNSKSTNARVGAILHEFAAAGRYVVIDVADITRFELNGHIYGQDTIGDRFKRRALEQILLVDAANDFHFELLNVVVDSVEKMRAEVASLPPSKLKAILKNRGAGVLQSESVKRTIG